MVLMPFNSQEMMNFTGKKEEVLANWFEFVKGLGCEVC